MKKIILRQHILNAHEIYNDLFFKGLLNTPDFRFYKTFYMEEIGGEVWGWYDSPFIGLTVNKNIYLTLLHEMIHQHQYEFNLIDKDHGTTFRKYARIIEQSLKLKKGSI